MRNKIIFGVVLVTTLFAVLLVPGKVSSGGSSADTSVFDQELKIRFDLRPSDKHNFSGFFRSLGYLAYP